MGAYAFLMWYDVADNDYIFKRVEVEGICDLLDTFYGERPRYL